SAWIAVISAAIPRILGMLQIGPEHIDMRNPRFEIARMASLLATYGIPLVIATYVYELLGGTTPQLVASLDAAGRIAFCAIVLVFTNNLIFSRIELAFGYSLATTAKTALVDHSIYIVTIP